MVDIKEDMSNFRRLRVKNRLSWVNRIKILKNSILFQNLLIWNINGMVCFTFLPQLYTRNLVAMEIVFFLNIPKSGAQRNVYMAWGYYKSNQNRNILSRSKDMHKAGFKELKNS